MGTSWDTSPKLDGDDSVTVVPDKAAQVLSEISESEALSVLVLSQNFIASYALPTIGEATIGRSSSVEVYVDDPLVSRRHAVITLGPRPTIRDLGSSNGTRVDGVMLAPAAERVIAVGDVVLVGSAALLVQRGAVSVQPRHFWTQEHFEARLKEECARTERTGRGFCVACIQVGRNVPDVNVRQILAAALRTSDVVGMAGTSSYGILLDATAEQAGIVLRRIVADLAKHEVTASWNIAQYPGDGLTAEELLAAAQPARRISAATGENTVIGDPVTQRLYDLADRMAKGDISILITGETGVGKEVMAEEIHRRSQRVSKPFLRLNCGALSENLLESELFGHERGAFTSAMGVKPGLLETADGGVVLLDEIGEMPMTLQVKLLRVLEEKQVRRVGGVKSRPLDVRFLAATNRDLEKHAARGLFRQDLYYRLAGTTLEIPPLRRRPGDIEPLTRTFLLRASRHLPAPPMLSAEAVAQLRTYRWPGNIRELKNVIERAVLLAGQGPITPAHLATTKVPDEAEVEQEDAANERDDDGSSRDAVLAALAACGGNQSRAAKQLGMSRGALIRRLERYGIVRPRKPD